MYLLDTNVLSALRRSNPAPDDRNVVTWAAQVAPAAIFLSVVTVYEIELGVLAKERRDSKQGAVLRAWLDDYVLATFVDRILDLTPAIAIRAAAFHVPNPKPERDSYIAGTAIVHGLTLVTRNVSDFRSMGVPLLNPWKS